LDTAASGVSTPVPGGWPAVYRALSHGHLAYGLARGLESVNGEPCLVVELPGPIRGIVPAGQAGLWPGQSLAELVGLSIPYRVTAVDRDAGVVILSRRQALEDLARETWRTAVEGGEIEARVIKVGKRLAVLEAGGVTAWLPYAELAHGYVADPGLLLTPGRLVRVRILHCEREARRLIVSLKAMTPDPWLGGPSRYREGGLYPGSVYRVRERGLWVELEPGMLVRTPHHRFLQPAPGERVLVRLVSCDWPRKLLWGIVNIPRRWEVGG